jgi:hypothetical protein
VTPGLRNFEWKLRDEPGHSPRQRLLRERQGHEGGRSHRGALPHHSDQRSQYSSEQSLRLLSDRGITSREAGRKCPGQLGDGVCSQLTRTGVEGRKLPATIQSSKGSATGSRTSSPAARTGDGVPRSTASATGCFSPPSASTQPSCSDRKC